MPLAWDCIQCGTENFDTLCHFCGKTKEENNEDIELERRISELIDEQDDKEKYRPLTGRPIKKVVNEWPDNPCMCATKTCSLKERYYKGCITGKNTNVGGV